MPKKITNDEFIVKAKKVHGNTYIYDKTEYKTAHSPVIITCRLHGDFEQIAHYHTTGGNGCSHCGGTKRQTKDEFVAAANRKYGNKYNYSKFVYKNQKTKGKIICRDHGEFWQTPGAHLAAHVVCGCPKCGHKSLGESIRNSQEEFEASAKAKHGDKFDYGVYTHSNTPMSITCPVHGIFEMTPKDHLRTTHGCRTCATVTVDDYIRRASEIHKRFYRYEKTEYEGGANSVTVTCPVHGDFDIIASNHLNGSGCSDCWLEKNNGGHEPFTFEGGSYNNIDVLCDSFGIEGNERVAFKRRMTNIRSATDEEIRAHLDHVYVPRDREIVCQGITYPTLGEFYAAVQPVASIQSVGRWLRQGLTTKQVIDLPPSKSSHDTGAIYFITHVASGRLYVGQTTSSIERRWAEHRNAAFKEGSTKLSKAIREYGPDAFTVEMMFTDIKTGDLLNALETDLITQHNSVENGYNMLAKGKGGGNQGKPTEYNGRKYPTAKQASEAMAKSEKITIYAAEYRLRHGVTNGNIKLSFQKATEIRQSLREGTGRGELAQRYGVTKRSIRDIELGRTWK